MLKTKKKRSLQKLKEVPISEHLKEFRKRLIISFLFLIVFFILCFNYVDYIIEFIAKPLIGTSAVSLIYTGLQEAFFVKLKVAFWTSILFILPVFFYQAWRFTIPALHVHEKSKFLFIVFASPILFWLGIVIAYYFVVPQAWAFFAKYAVADKDIINISLLPKMSEYLSLFMQIILAFAIAFQFPVVLFLLVSLGVIALDTIKKGRRIVIVLAFVFAGIVTPPDPISQIVLAIFLILLFELTIFLLSIFNKKYSVEKKYEQ